LDLAEINLRKFCGSFPGDEKIAVAEKMMLQMKEVYASDLYDTARFYERTGKAGAAYLYYTRILAKYPETNVCASVNKRLSKMEYRPTSSPVSEPVKGTPVTTPPENSPLLQLQVQGLTVDSEEPQNIPSEDVQ